MQKDMKAIAAVPSREELLLANYLEVCSLLSQTLLVLSIRLQSRAVQVKA